MKKYEEYLQFPQWLGWLLIVGISAVLLGWGMVLHIGVASPARQWDFGAHEHAPAAAPYTSVPSPPSPEVVVPPAQTPPLPEGKPWDKEAYQPRSVLLERGS